MNTVFTSTDQQYRSFWRILGLTALLLALSLAVMPGTSTVRAQAGGPIILMGIDAEDGSQANAHGDPSIYAGVVEDGILANVTNGGTGILGIGCGKAGADDVTFFWTAVAADVGEALVCVNGAAAISAAPFDGFAMIGVASDVFNTPSGGLTQAELDALNAREADVADFINTGGGLFGLSNCQLNNPYGYLGGVGGFDCGTVFESDIEPTPAGEALGITSTNLDVTAWHDSYDVFPDFLEVLAFYPQLSGNPAAAIGGAQVIITQGITLEPATDENPAGTSHTVTATVEDSEGNPVVGTEVRFEVVDGPNAGEASDPGECAVNPDCTTDANGQVSWTYTSNGQPGTDTIEACFTDAEGVERCARAEKVWTERVIEEGRMTGGGNLRNEEGTRVSLGLTLQCDATETPNNLQVNWGGNRFHLEEMVMAVCVDDPTIEPEPPTAEFDTHRGSGTGRYNGESGATAEWRLTDGGEPGRNDTVELTITNASGDVVLVVAGNLEGGNLQAHDVDDNG